MIQPINVKAGYPFGARPYPLNIKNLDGTVFGWKHAGQDYPAPVGTPVYAPHGGSVTIARLNGSAGKEVRIVDKSFTSRLLHLNSISVNAGQIVKEGQLVGYSGKTGYVTGPHLHWSVSVNGKYVNPLLYVTPPAPAKPSVTTRTLKPGSWFVRIGPGTSYASLGTAKGGTSYQTQKQSNGWEKITFNGKIGYIGPGAWK